MDLTKKGFLSMSHGVRLIKTRSPSMNYDRSRMDSISCGYVVGSIMYAIVCTRPNDCYAPSVTSRDGLISVRVTGQRLRISFCN